MLKSPLSLGIAVWYLPHDMWERGAPSRSGHAQPGNDRQGLWCQLLVLCLGHPISKGRTTDQTWSLPAKVAGYISNTSNSLRVLLPKRKGCLFRNLGIQKSISSRISENLSTHQHISGTESRQQMRLVEGKALLVKYFMVSILPHQLRTKQAPNPTFTKTGRDRQFAMFSCLEIEA